MSGATAASKHWRRAVDGPFDLQRLPGDHFFLFDRASGFFPALTARLAALP